MKKLKYVLLTLLVIVLAVGGYVLYELKFKTYDTADPAVDALVEETFELELPDGEVVFIDKDGNIVEKATQQTGDTSSANNAAAGDSLIAEAAEATENTNNAPTKASDESATEKATSETKTSVGAAPVTEKAGQQGAVQADTTTTTPENEVSRKVTVADIKGKYSGTFTSLENQARGRLNGLVSQAASEYAAKKNAGESISYGYFYNKYMGAATSVEASTDAAVNTVVGLVEQELQASGFDKSYAQSFVADYNQTKESLRSEMMSKVLDYK